MKYLIFDAGPIISLTMNGLLPAIEALKKDFDGKFILTPAVKKEVIDRPMKIKKFKLEAMQVKKFFDKGVFTPSSEIVSNQKLHKETSRILTEVNNSLKSVKTNERIKILQEGEASCLAFSKLVGGDNMIIVDERITRILVEAPDKLRELIERKIKTPIEQLSNPSKDLGGNKLIRSTELIYIAHKKGLLQEKSKEFLEAALFALKFKGAAISSSEISVLKGMG